MAMVFDEDINILWSTWGKVATSGVAPGGSSCSPRRLPGGGRISDLTPEEPGPRGRGDERRLDAEGRQTSQRLDQADADQGVVRDVADGRGRGVREHPDQAECDREHEDGEGVQREPVLRVHGCKQERGPDQAQARLQGTTEQDLL